MFAKDPDNIVMVGCAIIAIMLIVLFATGVIV